MVVPFLSHSPLSLSPSLLSFACTFILFYQKLCSVFIFADVRAHACSLCLLFVSAGAAAQGWEQKKTGLALSLAPALVAWTTGM